MGRKRLGIVARSFTIETRQSELIDKLADRGNKPASHIVRMALVQYLKQYTDTWECLVCGNHNNDKFKQCWNCDADKIHRCKMKQKCMCQIKKALYPNKTFWCKWCLDEM